MISRKTFIPVFISLAVITLLTAALSHLCLGAEFNAAKWIVDSHPPLPPATTLLHAIYAFVWLLPLGTIATGVLLCRKSQLSSTQISWFVSVVVLALFIWFLLIVVSFFFVYSQRGHYIMPLKSP